MQIQCTKGQGESARSMDALTLMRPNGYFVNIWTTNTGFTWRQANLAILLLVLGSPRQQNHHVMNVQILRNPHARQKQNDKKALDKVKKKQSQNGMNSKPKRNKWNRLNNLCWYVQLLKSCWASLGFEHVGWGSSHKMHGHTLKRTKTLLRQFRQAKLLIQSL